MSSEVTSPFTVFFDRSGQPLDAGYVYIGTAGINPEVSPITVYWDSALTVPAAQPIRTIAGYPSQNGSPGTIIINATSYSIVVRDRNGALVYSNLNAFGNLSSVLYIQTYADLTALTTATGLSDGALYEVAGYAAPGDGGGGQWRYSAASVATADGGTILAPNTGGGRFLRLWGFVKTNAAWWGVVNDGIIDQTTKLQTAITSSYGYTLEIPRGIVIASNLTVIDELEIIGAGYTRSLIKQKTGATGDLLTITSSSSKHVVIRAVQLSGTATGNDVIALTGTLTSGTQIIDALVTLAGRDGISIRSTNDNNTVIQNTIIEACGRDGISFSSGAVSGNVTGCRLNTNVRYSIYATGNTLGPGHRFLGNTIGGGVAGIHAFNQNSCIVQGNYIILQSDYGIWLKGAQNCVVSENICAANTDDGIRVENGSQDGRYNTIADNQCILNGRHGISLSSSGYCTISANTILNNGSTGLLIFRSGFGSVMANTIGNNGATGASPGIHLDDDGSGASSNTRIIGNVISDLGAGNQTTGILNDVSAFNTTIIGNEITAATEVNILGGSVLYARDNIGWVTQNEGNTSILSGTTSITVNHGLDVTPVARDFTVVQSGVSTVAAGNIWITSVTSTQFTINCQTNPGASGLPLEWKANAFL
jgi:parallel beta-helix repeat protein